MEDNLFQRITDYVNTPKKNEEPLLTDEEVDRLVVSLDSAREGRGFTEEEFIKVIRWAEGVRLNESLLSLTLKGFTDIDWNGESDEPSFKSTALGNQVVEELNNGTN